MMQKPSYWEYLTYDKDGFVNGIRSDAPKDEIEKYESDKKLEESGIRL